MPRHPYLDPIDSGNKVKLDDYDPADTSGVEKDDGEKELDKLGEEFAELGNLLTYAGTHALLIVLQGRDASGKDPARAGEQGQFLKREDRRQPEDQGVRFAGVDQRIGRSPHELGCTA